MGKPRLTSKISCVKFHSWLAVDVGKEASFPDIQSCALPSKQSHH